MKGPGKPIPERRLGKFKLRVIERAGGFAGVVLPDTGGVIGPFDGKNANDVWRRLEEEAGKAANGYVGFAGAIARFLHFFPAGFSDPGYAAQERTYKVDAKGKLDHSAPLAEAAAGRIGFAEAALAAVQDTNLLAVPEKIKLRDLLRGPSADAFVYTTARFASGGGENELREIERVLRPHNCAKWTIATYLSFLWRPDRHMFLKPEVTRSFATRVGHQFAHEYDPQLGMKVYNSLLDLVRRTEEQLVVAGLEPRDRVDVQSFVYVVGRYKEADAPRPSSEA